MNEKVRQIRRGFGVSRSPVPWFMVAELLSEIERLEQRIVELEAAKFQHEMIQKLPFEPYCKLCRLARSEIESPVCEYKQALSRGKE